MAKLSYQQAVHELEALAVFPDKPWGLRQIQQALNQIAPTINLNPQKVILIAGTNGKGSTAATLEQLLMAAQQKVGLYTSPHLINTTERIRSNGVDISQSDFVKLYSKLKPVILANRLTHFEALTLMAVDYFFNQQREAVLDYAIFEVGLGGKLDATNAIDHHYNIITSIALDHQAQLGSDLRSIAENKFAIVRPTTVLVSAETQFFDLLQGRKVEVVVPPLYQLTLKAGSSVEPQYILQSPWGVAALNLLGSRAAQNAMLALTLFERLGFNPQGYLAALDQVNWPGRMSKIFSKPYQRWVYFSGDHNVAGVQSLVKILKDFNYKKAHVLIGIAKDKEVAAMLTEFAAIERVQLYLTETAFKPLPLNQYPQDFLERFEHDADGLKLLNKILASAAVDDLILVSGSLYLVGKLMGEMRSNLTNAP